ncbi:uncharacterized protein LOC134070208 isoform X3 [Sardina pilchardus]|uniref:uncharacterized protein LOC134070208 isoform X3 n=1 Tax=Sardina pilchardus TaxID=27697 RepID=UPI002E131484
MLLPSSLPALLLAVPLVLLVTGESESVLTNENLTNAVTTEQYHDNITMPPQVPTLNVTLLSGHTLPTKVSQGDNETSHSLPHNAHSNTTLQINETLLFDNTTEANITYEDNESFQDQEKNHPGWHCNAEQLELYSHMYCGSYFHNHMVSVPEQTWCDWEDIKITRRSSSWASTRRTSTRARRRRRSPGTRRPGWCWRSLCCPLASSPSSSSWWCGRTTRGSSLA